MLNIVSRVCLWALCISSLERCLCRPFAHFLLDCLSSWCGVVWVLHIFWRSNPCLRYLANMFPIWLVPFPVCLFVFFSHAEAFYFDEVPFVYSFIYVHCFRGHVCEDVAAWNVWDFPVSFPLGLLWYYNVYLSLLSTLNLFLCMV